MISICRTHACNVKNWPGTARMALRWCAAGMVERPGKQFRRVNGHMHLRSHCATRSNASPNL